MSDINKIKLSDGVEYDIADAAARSRLDSVEQSISGIDTTVISKMQDTIEANTEKVTSMQSDLSDAMTKVDANVSKVTDLESDVTAMGESIATNTAGVAENKANITALDARVTEAETDITALKSSKANAATVTALDKRVTANETNITANAQAITDLADTAADTYATKTEVAAKADKADLDNYATKEYVTAAIEEVANGSY